MKNVASALLGIAWLITGPCYLPAQEAGVAVDESLLAGLQGEWRMQSMVADGKQVQRDFEKDSAPMIIRGKTVGYEVDKPATDTIRNLQMVDGFIHLDIQAKGDVAVQRWLAKLDEDTLTLCIVIGGTRRPSDLSSAPGSMQLLSVSKRANRGPDAAPATKSESDGPRVWTSTVGTTTKALFVKLDGDVVVLRKADGAMLRVPLDKLSDADREWIRNHTLE